MSIKLSNNRMIRESIPAGTEAHEETVASQEEEYLEKTEEKLRTILISEDPSAYKDTVCVDCGFVTGSPDQELDQAAEELIAGDSDDPPLSREAVAEILRMTSNIRMLEV